MTTADWWASPDHPRHHRARRRRAQGERVQSNSPNSQKLDALGSYRRRRARLQQSADVRRRQHPHPEEGPATTPGAGRDPVHRDRGHNAARPSPPGVDVGPSPERQSRNRSMLPRDRAVREVLAPARQRRAVTFSIRSRHLAGHGEHHGVRDWLVNLVIVRATPCRRAERVAIASHNGRR